MNLYSNLLEILAKHNKTIDDIGFITCTDENAYNPISAVDIDNFVEAAKNTNWDEYGYMHELNGFLMIYGKEGKFIVRVGEYDGSMFLEYIDFDVQKPKQTMKFDTFHTKPTEFGKRIFAPNNFALNNDKLY